MKKSMFIGTLFLFLLTAIQSNAEMKMTPSGITFPDNSTQTKAVSGGGVSAPLNLNGNLNTGDYTDAPDGAIISGVNAYTGSFRTYGGYFGSAAYSGRGVYGYATGDSGRGVFGSASGTNGRGVYGSANPGSNGIGVYGYATGSNGRGVYGSALGANARGVYGYAGDFGSANNYGGYFEAAGYYGRGVYGYASNSGNGGQYDNYGGYFEAAGFYGKGVYASAPGLGGKGVYGIAGNNGGANNYGGYFVANGSFGTGVYGNGKKYDFYADGSNINYYPFTGAHETKFSENMPEETIEGLIVSVTGNVQVRKDQDGKTSLSSTLPTVILSSKANDRNVFGVVVSEGPLPRDHWYKAKEGERFGGVNALGEGRVWVTDIKGKIQAGDYITTSSVPGYGQMQDDDLLHSYTLGKAIETIDWEQITETVQHNGKTYKRYLIAVVYTSG